MASLAVRAAATGARTELLREVAQIMIDHARRTGSGLPWEMQLLGASQGKAA